MYLSNKDLKKAASTIRQFWKPEVICQFDESQVMITKAKGESGLKVNEFKDKLFTILKGVLVITVNGRSFELKPHDSFVVKSGLEYQAVAENEVLFMSIEKE